MICTGRILLRNRFKAIVAVATKGGAAHFGEVRWLGLRADIAGPVLKCDYDFAQQKPELPVLEMEGAAGSGRRGAVGHLVVKIDRAPKRKQNELSRFLKAMAHSSSANIILRFW
jgi:hypothetical protein